MMEEQKIPYTKRLAVPAEHVVEPKSEGPYFEDIEVGMELELKKPPITRLQIAQFATASGDLNPSHVDEDIARDVGKMGGIFAHGMLGMGMVGQVLTDFLWDRPLRMFSARATIIVRPGDALTCYAKVTRKWCEGDDNLVEFACGARNQRGETTHEGKAIAVLPHRQIAVHDNLTQPYLLQHRVIG
ncbi:MAG: MaoC/PaaZ C-terminal domain-containing protein [Xanthobacteraceae bacterium]